MGSRCGISHWSASPPRKLNPLGSQQGVGAGSGGGANQLALAISLRTAMAGRHGRGRIYVPYLVGAIGTNGQILPAATSALATHFAKLISQLNGITPVAGAPVAPPTLNKIAVQSRTNPGVAAPQVRNVAVGSVVDTIRGRRNKIKEIYSLAAVAV